MTHIQDREHRHTLFRTTVLCESFFERERRDNKFCLQGLSITRFNTFIVYYTD